MCKSEDKKGKAAQEPTMKSNFETVVGRGIYTSGYWRKAVTYSAPLLYPGQRHLIKFVLLVEVPGDLSDHGVGVAHKAQAIYKEPPKTRKKKKAMMFHMDEGKDSWLINPSLTISMLWPPTWAICGNLALARSFCLGPGRSTRHWVSRIVSMICPPG